MDKTNIGLVAEFNKRFDLPDGSTDLLAFRGDAAMYRMKFMLEELNEFKDAYVDGDRVKMFDALIDLVYVATGTALFMGIDPGQWEAGFAAVHQANMAKVRAERPEQSKRGSIFDVVKPEGWVSPEPTLAEILTWPKPAVT